MDTAVKQLSEIHMHVHIFTYPNRNTPHRRPLGEIGNGGHCGECRVGVLSAPACCTSCDHKHLDESYSPSCISGINYTAELSWIQRRETWPGSAWPPLRRKSFAFHVTCIRMYVSGWVSSSLTQLTCAWVFFLFFSSLAHYWSSAAQATVSEIQYYLSGVFSLGQETESQSKHLTTS